MLNLRLKQIRKEAGIRSQREMAERIGEKERTYASWERGEVTMNLEQAYNVCMVLGCTLNDLVGMESHPRSFSDPLQAEVNAKFEQLNTRGKIRAVDSLEDIAANAANLKDGEATAHAPSGRAG